MKQNHSSDFKKRSKSNRFEKFWPYYLKQHKKASCRNLHYIGTTLFFLCAGVLMLFGYWYLMPLAFIPAYAFAWAGHYGVEGNRPATFSYPGLSLRGDLHMFYLFITGRINSELARHIPDHNKND